MKMINTSWEMTVTELMAGKEIARMRTTPGRCLPAEAIGDTTERQVI